MIEDNNSSCGTCHNHPHRPNTNILIRFAYLSDTSTVQPTGSVLGTPLGWFDALQRWNLRQSLSRFCFFN
ncbi:hypothetical protein D3C84_398180 [compost metagenome]